MADRKEEREIRDGRLIVRDDTGRVVSAKVHRPSDPAPVTSDEYADRF